MLQDQDRAYLERLASTIAAAQTELDLASANRDDAIRFALESGAGPTELAHIFGLTRARIYQIKDGRR